MRGLDLKWRKAPDLLYGPPRPGAASCRDCMKCLASQPRMHASRSLSFSYPLLQNESYPTSQAGHYRKRRHTRIASKPDPPLPNKALTCQLVSQTDEAILLVWRPNMWSPSHLLTAPPGPERSLRGRFSCRIGWRPFPDYLQRDFLELRRIPVVSQYSSHGDFRMIHPKGTVWILS